MASSLECSDYPPAKKQKIHEPRTDTTKLEDRLNHILSCSVCLDLPPSACMQCCHGHLMCIGCYHHLLGDARLKDEQATCPTCRVDIMRGSCTRNLAVEKAISELPVQCKYCNQTFSRSNINAHEKHYCPERKVACKFSEFGCLWKGPASMLDEHIKNCPSSSKTPSQLLHHLGIMQQQKQKEVSNLNHIVSLLSCEHISYTEIQLRPYRTDDFVTKLFYETNRFHLLGQTWCIKAFISAVENHPSNPTCSADRSLSFRLYLKSKITEPLDVEMLLLRAPYDDVDIKPQTFYNRFTPDVLESPDQPIETQDTNRMLGAKVISLRLFMFMYQNKQ